MQEESRKKGRGNDFMLKLSAFIVEKRNQIFVVFIVLGIFSLISRGWVNVENALDTYLPEESETKQALNVMDDQFTTFGTAQLMFANVTYTEAQGICGRMETIEGVQSVEFDETTDHYNNASALYDITFDYDEDDENCVEALARVQEAFADYDTYLSTGLGNSEADLLNQEVNLIMFFVAFVVVGVLIFTSQTYAEVPVLIITFLSAMIINTGTNFLLGTISFISNSVTSILQLALSLDYAIMLCNRFKEEHQSLPANEAVVVALSKSIPEVFSSSLTTIGGLCAMMFMQFKVGPDMAINLIKSIILALMSVFLLMPGLLVVFAPLMDKTKHKNFVPTVSFVGKFAYSTRKIVPPVFLVVVVAAFFISNHCPYAYGKDNIPTPKQNEIKIAKQMIKDNFTESNMVALVVPAGDYEKEGELLRKLETYDEVEYTKGLSNVEARDGYMLADMLKPRAFAELVDVDYELARLLYTAYAVDHEEYGRIIGGIESYRVPLMDMFLFVHDCVEDGYVTLEDDQKKDIDDAYDDIIHAQMQLCGDKYSRMLVYLTLPLGKQETYSFLDTIREEAQAVYPDGNVYVAGNATTEYDFQKSFDRDNGVVSAVSILIVLAVLLFTFNSAGMPILLILVIEGSILLNFSAPTVLHNEVFFMSYLVVSSIQMGANIDYAIVIGNRFVEMKEKMPKREAMIETMNFAFPTILTSGSILAISGILVGRMTSDAAVNGMGNIGRGTIISMILVMFVLPQILLIGEKVIDKTSFAIPVAIKEKKASGRIRLDGRVYGEVSGVIRGEIHAVVDGDVDVKLIAGTAEEEGGDGDDAEDGE